MYFRNAIHIISLFMFNDVKYVVRIKVFVIIVQKYYHFKISVIILYQVPTYKYDFQPGKNRNIELLNVK